MAGGLVSTTNTVCEQVLVFPHASVALQVRVAENVGPQPALVVVLTTAVVALPQVSLAPGSSKVHGVPHSTVLFVAQLITGGVVSTTEMVWAQVLVLPTASTAW